MKKQFITEAARLQKLAGIIAENLDNQQSIGFLFRPEEDEDGMIDYVYDKDKVIEVIRSLLLSSMKKSGLFLQTMTYCLRKSFI